MSKVSQGHMIKRYYRFYRKKEYTGAIAFSIVFMLLTTCVTLLLPYIPRYAIDKVLVDSDYEGLWRLFAFVCLLLLTREVSKYFYSILLMTLNQKVILNMRNDLMGIIYARDFKELDRTKTGYLRSRILDDTVKLGPISLENVLNIIFCLIYVAVAIGYLFIVDPILSLVMLFCIGINGWVTHLPKNKLRERSHVDSENWAGVNAFLQEKLMGLGVAKLHNAERGEARAVHSKMKDAVDYSIGFRKFIQLFQGLILLVASLSIYTTLVLAFLKVMDGVITLGTCVSFFAFAQIVYNLTTFMYVEYTKIRAASGPLERVFNILSEKDRKPEAYDPPVASGSMGRDILTFRDIRFAYPNGDEVLRDVNFEIHGGSRVAIIGESGSGKSTLCKLGAGMYRPTSGEVCFRGQNIRHIDPAILRKEVGVVLQNHYLFSGSILANIKFHADVDFSDVVRAAKMVEMHDFIEGLPNRYDTPLSELGDNLSGGQRQRLCIARVLVRNPSVVIFDEITSHIDNINERKIMEALDLHFPETTQIFITHSAYVMRNVHKILLVEKGKILVAGAHAELYRNSRQYRNYLDSVTRESDLVTT